MLKSYVKKTINMFNCKSFLKIFSDRLLGNVIVTIYQGNKNNSKNGQLCTKITQFCVKTREYRNQDTVLLKESDTNLVCFLKERKFDLFS